MSGNTVNDSPQGGKSSSDDFEARLQKKFEKQRQKVQEQAIEDAANNRNRTLLKYLVEEGEGGDHGNEVKDFSYKRAERVNSMLIIQDATEQDMGNCRLVVEQAGKRPPKEQLEAEIEARDALLGRVKECRAFIKEMKDLNITACDAKDTLLKEDSAGRKMKETSLETQVAKQHKQTRKPTTEKVNGQRVWAGSFSGTSSVKKADPWTDREKGNREGMVEESLSKQYVEDVKNEQSLFNSALKPLIKETQSNISEMYTLLAEAKRQYEIMKRRTEPKMKALHLDRKTLTELRRYNYPPKVLHKLVQAMFLLLGFDEYTTFEWDRCKTLLNPNGSKHDKGLNTRIEEFRAEELKEAPMIEIAERANTIMQSLDFSEVNKTSPAAVTIYIWVSGALKDIGPADGNEGADVRRQIEILLPKDSRQAQKLQADYRLSGAGKNN